MTISLFSPDITCPYSLQLFRIEVYVIFLQENNNRGGTFLEMTISN